MKKIKLLFSGVLFALTLMLCSAPETASAADYYVCDYQGYQVYVDSSCVVGSQYQFLVINGVRFVVGGKEEHFATAKFYLQGNTWWGNLMIDNIPSTGDYPVYRDSLTQQVFNVAKGFI
ncbi:hypothetical protein [Anaerovibrio sp.]|uniref:hypothetical protein n=1 Tax=Anaerovibrio sp. TaxID=1872532 RepID=UPI003890C1D7